jgi:hypothetical protein
MPVCNIHSVEVRGKFTLAAAVVVFTITPTTVTNTYIITTSITISHTLAAREGDGVGSESTPVLIGDARVCRLVAKRRW